MKKITFIKQLLVVILVFAGFGSLQAWFGFGWGSHPNDYRYRHRRHHPYRWYNRGYWSDPYYHPHYGYRHVVHSDDSGVAAAGMFASIFGSALAASSAHNGSSRRSKKRRNKSDD